MKKQIVESYTGISGNKMKKNEIKQKLKENKPSIGVWQALPSPGIARILACSGFDWIVFDAEHGHYTLSSLISTMDGLGNSSVSPLVRVSENNPTVIKQILDIGAEGVVVPMVCTPEEARKAVAACKYPPLGIRGIGGGRAADYGENFKDYIDNANDNILIIIQIEHVKALEHLDEIVRVEGIDGLFIGPMDLSASMGIPGQTTGPRVIAAIEKVIDTCKKANVASGMYCQDEEHAVEMIRKGMQFIAYTEDKTLLSMAAKKSINSIYMLLGRGAAVHKISTAY